MTSLRDATPTSVIADSQYSYNTASQIVQQVDPGGAHAYGYDSVDRLASAAYPGATAESYNYDSVGNRTTSHLSPTHGYQPFNQLSSTSTASYAYDSNGDLISKTDSSGTWQYAWDFENRLTQVTRPDAVTISYGYDAVGRRIQRTPSNGEVQKYVYDGQDVVRDLHADGSVALEYLNGPGIDNKIRQTDSANEDLYYTTDHLGSTIALTNDLGEMVEGIGYDSFGNSTGSSLTRYTYTGREFDADTGLYYYRARWYDAQVGRFISEDPLALSGGINLYTYVKNDPVRFIDPSGLTRCNRWLGGLGGALLGGGIGGLVGEAATTVAGAVGGFAVAGPPGALVGAGAGAGAGVPVSVITGGAGAVIGGVAGYRFCASDDAMPTPRAIPTCDNPPKPIPFPPAPPPGFERCTLRSTTATHCIYTCGKFKRIETRRNDGHCPKEYFIGTISIP